MKTSLAPPRVLPARPSVPGPLNRFLAFAKAAYAGLTPDQKAGALVALTAAILSVWNVVQATGYQDDEGTYTAQALSSLRGDLAPYTYWYDHPPLGWLQLAGLSWIPLVLGQGGESAVGQMRYVTAVFFVCSAVLVFLVARRLQLRTPIAVMAGLLFSLSPLSLVLGRQVFIDNVGVPWLLLSFYLALCPQVKLWNHIGAGLCFAVAIMSKETLAIFGPTLLLALVHRPFWQTRLFSVVGFLSAGGLALAFYPLMAALRGELITGQGHVSLQDALSFQFISREGSGSFFDPASDRAELVQGWLYYDSPLILAGLGASLLCLLRHDTRWIPAGLLLFSVPVVLGNGYLPAMYIIASVPFLALAVAVATDLAWRTVTRRVSSLPGFGEQAAPSKNTLLFRRLVRAGTAAVLVIALGALLLPHWLPINRSVLTAHENADWDRTLQWTKDHLPHEDTALVPYSMWSDLNADGRHDPWKVIALEKMDRDSDFEVHHDGWRDIDWIIEGPSTGRNIDGLGLTNASIALENSRVVATFGAWKVREVLNDGARSTSTAPGA
ncbi:MAG: glycosyltransferase family 39 protein [Micrococcus sp.]|nr:glycosyltransferase family 39 protein [Micrococcus sp.]